MDAQDCRVWVHVWGKPVEVEAIRFVRDSPVQRLKLVALERGCLVDVAVKKLDDNTLLLYVGDAESVVRERRDERCPLVEFVQKRVPRDAERHACCFAPDWTKNYPATLC